MDPYHQQHPEDPQNFFETRKFFPAAEPSFNEQVQNQFPQEISNWLLGDDREDFIGTNQQNQNYHLVLISSAFAPIQIQPNICYTIGRSPQNSIVLASNVVSKQHALFQVDFEGRSFIEDLQSTNGICINGERIETRQKLNPNDKITIGSFQMFYKKMTTEQINQKLSALWGEDKTDAFNAENQDSMAGSLSHMSIADIFSMVENNEQTGVLSVNYGENSGKIWFQKGRIIHCKFNEFANSIEVLFQFLCLEKGGFEFLVKSSVNIRPELSLSPEEVMFEYARRIDENK